MKAVRLADVRGLISSEDFLEFWRELTEARRVAHDASERAEEFLTQATLLDFRAELAQKHAIDTLESVSDLANASAHGQAECSALENRALELVARFEDQRFSSSEQWYRLIAAERALEIAREKLSEARNAKDGTIGRWEAEVSKQTRIFGEAEELYRRESAKKNALWLEVEGSWARSAELSLVVAEKSVQAKAVRKKAEALFAQTEERQVRARQLRAEAKALIERSEESKRTVARLLADALPRFGGIATDGFLYLRHADLPKAAFAVGLVADKDSYNLEVGELQLFLVDRNRGVAFLEPAVDGAGARPEDDRRLEEYFLLGRKGRTRASGSPASNA